MAKVEMIKSFGGGEGVNEWIAKVELVANLTGVNDVASFLPLFLEGGALAVYMEMTDESKAKIEDIKCALRDAFTDSQFTAYSKLRSRRWTGESVDVYANDVRKLARECGFVDAGLEHVVKLAFVSGFPDQIGVELQQVQGVNNMKVADILVRARVLAASKGEGGLVAQAQRVEKKHGDGSVFCFDCKGPHYRSDCPQRRPFKCYNCGEEGHIARRCRKGRKDDKGYCATGCPLRPAEGTLRKVPVVDILVGTKGARALVDTGCTNSLMTAKMAESWTETSTSMIAFDGRSVSCRGNSNVDLTIGGEKITTTMTVVDKIVGNVDVVLGMDIIKRLGGVTVSDGTIQFGRVSCVIVSAGCEEERKEEDRVIVDKDFEAKFDGTDWTVRYRWKEGEKPKLKNTIAQYTTKLDREKQESYDKELERWIREGILKEWTEEVEGILPLMAVEQQNKGKVRPVLDFRELNAHVECHTGDEITDICGERLREWRQVEGEAELVDLKAAYLQIKVSRELWKYQLVKYKGKMYCLTRLGFGLNSAPRIMSKILKTVLRADQKVGEATSSYIDDIYVDVAKTSSTEVIKHLGKFGLVAKPAEKLENGAALGLKLKTGADGSLRMSRGNEVPKMSDNMNKKELFSACGRLVGHYPLAGWLRVACSFVKRHAEGKKWTDYVGNRATKMLEEIIDRVGEEDPVKGKWRVQKTDVGKVWCDASDLALGAVVEIGGEAVEDAAWMRKKDDYSHINIAELEAVLKGINLCLKWGLKVITVLTDSATVCGWIKMTISEEKRVKTKGAAEMLVKRRLGVLKGLIEELNLSVNVQFVNSGCNKADILTRVKRGWLHNPEEEDDMKEEAACATACDVKKLHDRHHMGVERTWFLAKKIDPSVTKNKVKEVVKNCIRCQSIDPAPVTHEGGDLGVNENWTRLAIDVTHYRNQPYLTILDCGPGRFAIWRLMKNETAAAICTELDQIFFERGSVEEILMDNATAFRSEEMKRLLDRWAINPFFRAAYRPSGNGIVERNHRTVKAMAEKGSGNPIEAVYWYNTAPRDRQKTDSVPRASIFKTEWRVPGLTPNVETEEPERATVEVGEEVWVKPPNSRCTSQWTRGIVTKVNSSNNVEVRGVPRHILDLRKVPQNVSEDDRESREPEAENGARRYPTRDRQAPPWLNGYTH